MSVRKNNRLSVIEELEPRRLFTTWYVATTGLDTNAGNIGAPFLTLQHAANSTAPGDTVIVEPGSYGGFVLGWDNPQGGTVNAPITYQAQAGVYIVSRDNKTPDGIDLEPGDSYVNIYGFNVINQDGSITSAGISVKGSNYVNIVGNVCTGNGEWGIFTSFSNFTLIQGNTCANSINQHGIYVSNSADHPTIIDNICYGNAEAGIHLNGDLSQGGSGLVTFATIEDNTLYNNGRLGASAINGDGLTDSIIENNLLYGNHNYGISLFQIDAAAGATNNIIANNTIVMAADGGWAININTNSTGNVLFNNIILSHNTSRGSIDITSDSLPGLESDYNIITGQFEIDGDIVNTSQWQIATGQDIHSILGHPGSTFANPGASNFNLLPGASAVGLGVATFDGDPAPTVDFNGNSRLTGIAFDVGALQFTLGPLAIVANVTASTTLTIAVQLTWDPVANAASYQVFSSNIDNINTASKLAVQLTSTNYTDNTATTAEPEYYWVRARNPAGVGQFSGGTTGTGGVQGLVNLGTPGSIGVTNGTLSNDVRITWAAVTGARSYQVFRSTTNDITTATKIAWALTTDQYDDTSAVPGQTYYYWVRARNPVGVGLFSNSFIGSAI